MIIKFGDLVGDHWQIQHYVLILSISSHSFILTFISFHMITSMGWLSRNDCRLCCRIISIHILEGGGESGDGGTHFGVCIYILKTKVAG